MIGDYAGTPLITKVAKTYISQSVEMQTNAENQIVTVQIPKRNWTDNQNIRQEKNKIKITTD